MNIYLVVEDGVTFCVKAPTMYDVIKFCEIDYLNEIKENTIWARKEELKYYHEQILQSCSFVGELKNDE